MREVIKISVVILGIALLASLAFAGPIRLQNVPGIRASQAIATNADASVTWSNIRINIDNVGVELDNVSSSLDAIDLSAADPSAFTNSAQKTSFKALKQSVSDLKDAVKSLKITAKNQQQAVNKIVKKLKETERVTRASTE